MSNFEIEELEKAFDIFEESYRNYSRSDDLYGKNVEILHNSEALFETERRMFALLNVMEYTLLLKNNKGAWWYFEKIKTICHKQKQEIKKLKEQLNEKGK